MSSTPLLSQVTELFDSRFDPRTAESWDRVGLITGDPDQPVSRILWAVDPLPAVIEQAVDTGVDLLVTHHPLLLRGVHSVAATTAKGRALRALIQSGCALVAMHTNADGARDGVSDALADAVGMSATRRPIRAIPDRRQARVVCQVPESHSDALIAAMTAAGAGRIGEYDFCAFWVDGTGQFRPLPGADPHIGQVGALERIPERRLEMVLPSDRVGEVVHALRTAHPYEEPAFSIVESAELPGVRGTGRHGTVPPAPLGELAATLHERLPPTAHGIRVAGDPDRIVSSVAVCGGSGDSLLDDVRALGVDAYVASDLRHHPTTDFVADGGGAVLDVAHWAGEWLWLAGAARWLGGEADRRGWAVSCEVSAINTDPWTFRL